MKKKLSVVFSALLLAISVPLAAQTFPLMLTANIPFEFNLGGKVLPAGEYTIQNISNPSVVIVRSFDNRAAAMVALRETESIKGPGSTRLTFNRYGDSYFLSAIWNGRTGSGNMLPVTRTEKELIKTASVQRFEVLASLARR